MDVERLMQQDRRGIGVDVTVFEANTILVEREAQAISVLRGDEGIGVFTFSGLMTSMRLYIGDGV